MSPANPLDSVYFINLPKGFSLSKKAMAIDTSIPLPVQKKTSDEDGIPDIKELTQEQILSGILTVLAYDKTNEHLEYYRKIIKEARPDIKTELAEAAILKTGNEDWELAEEIWRALHGLEPESVAVILNMAIFFDQRADNYRKNSLHDDADAYDELAISYYKEAMTAEPEVPEAFFNAAYFYLKKHNYADAKGCFESYIALTADMDDKDLGEDGVERKKIAQENINKIENRSLENEHFHMAYELIASGQEDKGIAEIRKFIQDNPYVWNAWFMLGWGLRRMERYEDAIMAFEKARECEGGDENADTLNELAICQIETGRIDDAMDTLNDALSIDPDNTKVISNLGFIFLKKGNESEARKYFVTVLEIDPKDEIAKKQLEILERSC